MHCITNRQTCFDATWLPPPGTTCQLRRQRATRRLSPQRRRHASDHVTRTPSILRETLAHVSLLSSTSMVVTTGTWRRLRATKDAAHRRRSRRNRPRQARHRRLSLPHQLTLCLRALPWCKRPAPCCHRHRCRQVWWCTAHAHERLPLLQARHLWRRLCRHRPRQCLRRLPQSPRLHW